MLLLWLSYYFYFLFYVVLDFRDMNKGKVKEFFIYLEEEIYEDLYKSGCSNHVKGSKKFLADMSQPL